ncbi:MAG: 5'-nucleotidase C-terminal domain-containing protein [Mangrovicoccus sp.]|nr:5'-nucleotidase C-terminal domain-containing protein [Mangrovicoccus sp.]
MSIDGTTPPASPTGRLRILATTDLHMSLFPWNYGKKHLEPCAGLLCLADKINALRQEGTATLLLDNGDFIQGELISDWHASLWQTGTREPHPMISAFESLSFDAVGLGNHEFDRGLAYLADVLAPAQFPCIASNLETLPTAPDLPLLPWVLLSKEIADPSSELPPAKIGIFSLLPQRTANWNRRELAGKVAIHDVFDSAQRVITELQDAGADVIIALSHLGITPDEPAIAPEESNLALARLSGIDAIIAGHTHMLFPGPDHQNLPGLDAQRGTLHDIPCVMPGSHGSHLGDIELSLHYSAPKGWQVQGHQVTLHTPQTCPTKNCINEAPAVFRNAHERTTKWGATQLGHTEPALHSYFTPLQSGAMSALIADAQLWAFRQYVSDTKLRLLPMISVVAPMLSGGLRAPGAYVDIPSGPISRAAMRTLFPFHNTLHGLVVSPDEIRDWLDHAVASFAQITPGQPDQPLLGPNWLGYNFDVFHGLRYTIDLTLPPKAYGSKGPSRIRNITYQEQPWDAEPRYLLITNDYRANGGGGFPGTGPTANRTALHITVQAAIEHYLQSIRTFRNLPTPSPFTYAPCPDASMVFATGPGAQAYRPEITGIDLSRIGQREDGFDLYRLRIGEREDRK